MYLTEKPGSWPYLSLMQKGGTLAMPDVEHNHLTLLTQDRVLNCLVYAGDDPRPAEGPLVLFGPVRFSRHPALKMMNCFQSTRLPSDTPSGRSS